MKAETKQKLLYWVLGIFTGGAIATPVTAVAVNHICKKKQEAAISKAYENGSDDGMKAMAEYVTEVEQNAPEPPKYKKIETDISDDDINNYNVKIDDDEAMEEAYDRMIDHERYLDMIAKYSGDEMAVPRKIDEDKFLNESYMQKANVNWYDEDNVFEEDLMTIDDPYALFGVTDGHDLFANPEGREDPDIVYIRNEGKLEDYEITRIHGSYANLVGGERSIGQTDS